MEERTSRSAKILTVLVAFLIAVVAFQTYYLLRVQERLNSAAGQDQRTAQASAKEPDVKTWSLPPDPGSAGSPNPIDPLFSAPIDPNSWDPFKEMDAMQKQMQHLFDNAFGKFQTSPQFGSLMQGFAFDPETDITENGGTYVVRMDIPGTDSSRIKATIEDRTLTISGTREEEVSQQNAAGSLWRKERRLGQFERSVILPGPVKQEGMNAKYENGVLTITIPKDTNAAKPGTIPIQ